MPRKSKVDIIIEKNKKTFDKYPNFVIWYRKHLKNVEDIKKYEEAFNKYKNPVESTEDE